MSRTFGRCPRCLVVRELYADGRTMLCEDCCGRSYENYGRPTLPIDGRNRLMWDIDMLQSQIRD